MNLTSVMLVMKKVKDMRRVSKAMQIPQDHLTEILESSEEDSVGDQKAMESTEGNSCQV